MLTHADSLELPAPCRLSADFDAVLDLESGRAWVLYSLYFAGNISVMLGIQTCHHNMHQSLDLYE